MVSTHFLNAYVAFNFMNCTKYINNFIILSNINNHIISTVQLDNIGSGMEANKYIFINQFITFRTFTCSPLPINSFLFFYFGKCNQCTSSTYLHEKATHIVGCYNRRLIYIKQIFECIFSDPST